MATAKKTTGKKKVEKVMHEYKHGTLKSGQSDKKVKSRKQAVAIALSEAREAGANIPKKSAAKKSTASKKTSTAKKASPAKKTSTAKKSTAAKKKTSTAKKK